MYTTTIMLVMIQYALTTLSLNNVHHWGIARVNCQFHVVVFFARQAKVLDLMEEVWEKAWLGLAELRIEGQKFTSTGATSVGCLLRLSK